MIKLLNKGSEGLDEFAKESDKTGNTLSNIDGFKKNLQAQREFHAAMKGLQIQIGQALMPVILFLSEFLVQHVAPAFTRVSGYVATHKDLLSTVGKVVAATAVAFALLTVAAKAQAASILIAEVGMKGYLLQTKIGAALGKAFAAAQWLVNAAMSANPLALVVLALVGLGVALVMAYKKSETFRNIVQGVFRAVSTAAQNTIGWVKSHWPLLLAILLGPFALAALAIGKNWDKIKSGGQSVLDFVKGMPHKISGFFSGIWSGLANGLKSAINAVLHLPITIPKINTHIPGVGTVGGQTLIPALAKGGIVTRPTLALIGEAGPEAVVPLSRFNGGRSGGGDVVRITINGAMDPKAVAAQIETMLANLKRTSRGGGKLAFQ